MMKLMKMYKLDYPVIDKIDTVADEKFIKLYKASYQDGHKYIVASRRNKNNLAMNKNDSDFSTEYPDAVSIFTILRIRGKDCLLLTDEYRHPLGRYIVGVPAGIIDDKDKKTKNPIKSAAIRELFEETGIDISKQKEHYEFLINKEAFSSPGFTDESNALFGVVTSLDDFCQLNHDNAESTELLGNFYLVDKLEAKDLLMKGVDILGFSFPLVTFAALTYFVSDIYLDFITSTLSDRKDD